MSESALRWSLIAVLGAAGTLARALVSVGFERMGAVELPWATFTVNITGAFLMGLVYALMPSELAPVWRVAIGMGALGAFTTFSSLMWELMEMVDEGQLVHAGAYLLLSVAIGFTAMVAGSAAGRAL